MNASVEIPQYQCHKKVRAARITEIIDHDVAGLPNIILGEIGGQIEETCAWHLKHKPQVGGYYVVYEDGYKSFSPAEAFESGYTRL